MPEINALHRRMLECVAQANVILTAHGVPAMVTALAMRCEGRFAEATIKYDDDRIEHAVIAAPFLYPITLAEAAARYYLFRLDSIRDTVNDELAEPIDLPAIDYAHTVYMPGHQPYEDERAEADEIDSDPRINSAYLRSARN